MSSRKQVAGASAAAGMFIGRLGDSCTRTRFRSRRRVTAPLPFQDPFCFGLDLELLRDAQSFHPPDLAGIGRRHDSVDAFGAWNFQVCEQILKLRRFGEAAGLKTVARSPMTQ